MPEGADPGDVVFFDKAGVPPAAGNANVPPERAPAKVEQVARKIVYTATIDLVVEDYETSRSEMLRLLKENKGYIAQSELRGTPGAPRSGTWTLRVPVEHFEDFTDAIAKIGELRRHKLDSKDITDAYYDLRAHIKNDEIREQGLQKLYIDKVAGSKLEDLLAVDRELSSVRGRIDSQKGQIQRWDKETALATIHLNLFDLRVYVPTTDPEFNTVINRTFQKSVKALVNFGKALLLVAVALTPWLPVIAIALAALVYLFRRWRRRLRAVVPPLS